LVDVPGGAVEVVGVPGDDVAETVGVPGKGGVPT